MVDENELDKTKKKKKKLKLQAARSSMNCACGERVTQDRSFNSNPNNSSKYL